MRKKKLAVICLTLFVVICLVAGMALALKNETTASEITKEEAESFG